jgi:fructoselysine-6-P-deglycase FrlB-like protein
MLTIEREIASQPAVWRRSAELAAAEREALPAAGERIALIGCGTSYFAAQSIAVLRETSGLGESDAFAASEFPLARRYDRVVAISRSGTTTEVVRVLEALAGRPAALSSGTGSLSCGPSTRAS